MLKENLFNEVEPIVRKAGEIVTGSVLTGDQIIRKGPANYVTDIDYKVQEYLCTRLNEMIPGCNIITEESDKNRFDLDAPTWILDPVDGTTNLMYRYNHSAISLALLADGVPALGMIYNPFTGEMFSAEHGKGAYLNGQLIKVSHNQTLEHSLVAFGTTPYDKRQGKKTFEAAERVFSGCRDVRRSGSAALDIAYVACGRIDGFFEFKLQPWDFAAGFILLKEAGGNMTNIYGESLNLISADSVLASNGSIHGELKKIIL